MRKGSLLVPDDGTVNERERKKLHFLRNVFIILQTKPFLNFFLILLFFSFFGSMPFTPACSFPLGWISISKLLQMRQGCKFSSNSVTYADAWTCKNDKSWTCNWKLHPAKFGKQVEEVLLVVFSCSVRWQPYCLEILLGNQSWLAHQGPEHWLSSLPHLQRPQGKLTYKGKKRSSKISRFT